MIKKSSPAAAPAPAAKNQAGVEGGGAWEAKAPVQKRALETRRKILESARALFSEIGFEATTTHLIAQGAGVSVGGLYAHFPNKEEIFLRLIADQAEHVHDVTRSCLARTAEEKMSPADAIDHIFSASYAVYSREVKLNLEVARFARVNSRAAEIHDYWEGRESRLVADWMAGDKAALNVDDVEAAVTVVARSAHEVFQYLYKNHGQVDPDRILRHLTLMIKRFLLK
ncbi:MAG: TetR/AcrR family transcriptional regulator [Pseudomonadota bacterium]